MKDQIEQQAIEEMAKVIETTEQIARDAHCGLPSPTMYAKSLYWRGYRLQSEGEWLDADICSEDMYCSVCGGIAPVDCEKEEFYKSNFCPNCGAHMKGGAE